MQRKDGKDPKARARALLKEERGAVIKPRGGRTTVALVYPNTYYVGMSSLGFQTVYRIINGRKDALAERVFLPDEAERDAFRKNRTPLFAMESQTPVSNFDIAAFSVSFENDYSNVAETLRLSGMPPMSRDRGDGYPLVILGGICTFFNPEPIADFFDLVVIGEAEDVLTELLDAYEEHKHLPRKDLLNRLSAIPGIYIPSLYEPSYSPDGSLVSFRPVGAVTDKITRRYVKDIDARPAHSMILTPNTEFSNMFMVEVSRGCGRHCRFCMAGYLYRPPRAVGLERVMAIIEDAKGRTGKIGLVGAAVSDYPEVAALSGRLVDMDVNFSASSLRADSLTPELVSLVAKGNRTVAIAPEAGSERLRAVINKNITEAQILDAVRMLVDGNILNIKLYFMVGLPTETDEDVDAIVVLAKKAGEAQLEAARKKGRMGRLTLSINCFIPKPWTPFQWVPMDDVGSLNKKIKHIKAQLKGVSNIDVINDAPKHAYIQGALSRGDRRLSKVVLAAAENGGNWTKAFASEGLSMEFYAGRTRERDELFPWDFIDTKIKREYLWKENVKSKTGVLSTRCNTKKCKTCGVC